LPLHSAPEPFLDEHVKDVRVFDCPREFKAFLPQWDQEDAKSWSSFQKVWDEGGSWSETGLRRRLHKEHSSAQQCRPGKQDPKPIWPSGEDTATKPLPARVPRVFFSDEPEGLVREYIKALSSSLYGEHYSKELRGDPIPSPFTLEGWWVNHQIHCGHCRAFGDWAFVRRRNQDNPCYMADILACLHHGFLLPLLKEPPNRMFANYESLDLAPEASEREWRKMVDHKVVLRADEAVALRDSRGVGTQGPAFPFCGAPLLSVVKEPGTDASLALS
jgi:hypothetical protein